MIGKIINVLKPKNDQTEIAAHRLRRALESAYLEDEITRLNEAYRQAVLAWQIRIAKEEAKTATKH